MSIKNIVFPTTGLADASPKLLYIDTDDTLAEVLVAGYLNQAKSIYGNIFSNKQAALVYTTDSLVVLLSVSISANGATASLVSNVRVGQTLNIGGAGPGPINVPLPGLTTSSIVVATVAISSNPVSIVAASAGNNQFTIVFSGDPGVSARVNYVAYINPV